MSPTRIIGSWQLTQALYEEGLVPQECVDIKLLTPIDGVLQIQYTVNIKEDQMPNLARAFASAAKAVQS